MARNTGKPKSMVRITQRAVRELKAIQAANAKDESHVLRIETECEGFSLWLGPEQEGDTLVGSEDTILLRATPDLTKFLTQTPVIIDCIDHDEEGTRLIVYPADDIPPELSKPKRTRSTAQKPKQKPKKN